MDLKHFAVKPHFGACLGHAPERLALVQHVYATQHSLMGEVSACEKTQKFVFSVL